MDPSFYAHRERIIMSSNSDFIDIGVTKDFLFGSTGTH